MGITCYVIAPSLCERQVNRKEETDDRLRRKIRDKLSVVPFEPGCYLMKIEMTKLFM